jgi:nitrogen fixation/metabolism regulation signal transduction histidine kinase
VVSVAVDEWPRQQVLGTFIREQFAATGDNEWQAQLEMERPNGMPQVLLLRGSRLPGTSGGGDVVVFDDVTRLIAAQRSAAWGEVARRLAHEIKNPLTPIQLSAERLQFKLADKLANGDADMLARGTQTIINQVQAMKRMVDDFRDYARLPAPEVAPLDLNALIREVLGLYESSSATIDSNWPTISAHPRRCDAVAADHPQPAAQCRRCPRRAGRRIIVIRTKAVAMPAVAGRQRPGLSGRTAAAHL